MTEPQMNEWERIVDEGMTRETQRLKIPGGYLYRVVEIGDDGDWHVSGLVFVSNLLPVSP